MIPLTKKASNLSSGLERYLSLPLSLVLASSLGLVVGLQPARAEIVRNFDTYPGSTDPFRFQTNARGNILIIGNTLLTCDTTGGALNAGNCNAARNEPPPNAVAGLTNGAFNMIYTNTDPAAGSTFANSSTATLNLPTGSTVAFAGLYWGAHAPFTNPIAAAVQQVRFKTPAGGYTTITAQQLDSFNVGLPPANPNRIPYQGFADVTALVQAGGNGIYSVADVAAQSSSAPAGGFNVAAPARNRYAGWSLVVVYENPAEPVVRNLTVYDGFAFVRCPGNLGAATCTPLQNEVMFNVRGFQTPSTPPVLTDVGIVVYDGDREDIGEEFQINGLNLSDAPLRPVNDFFNSSITTFSSNSGSAATPLFPAKNPNFSDQLGFDIAVLDITPLAPIPPNSTSAQLLFRTILQQEGYSPGVFTLAVQTVTNANLRLVKRITNVTRNGATIPGVNFNSIVDDPNSTDDNAAGFSQIPLVGVPQIGAEAPLQSGDIIEYTVYFLSDGDGPAENVRFCDPIPTGTTFVEDSFGSGIGLTVNRANTVSTLTNASDADTGFFFSPLAPLPANNGCINTSNQNGSALVDLGSISRTPGLNFGFVRFKVAVD